MPKVIKVTKTQTHILSLRDVETQGNGILIEWSDRKTKDLVIFTESALADMKQYIHWGKRYANNLYEQQMIPVGYKCYDPKQQAHYILICYVLYMYCSKRSKVGASQICNERQVIVDSQIMEEVEFLNKAGAYDEDNPFRHILGEVSTVGKIHTHPNMEVFLSSVDKIGHISGSDFWVDIVANPQDQKIAAFGAEDAHPCQLLVLAHTVDSHNEEPEEADAKCKKDKNLQTICVNIPEESEYYIRKTRRKFMLVCKAKINNVLNYLVFKKEMKKLE